MTSTRSGALKLTSLIDRRADLDLEQFSLHWRTAHRALALRLIASGIMLGYVQNHRAGEAIPEVPAAGDGAPELWIPSVTEVLRLGTLPEYLAEIQTDERRFMNGASRWVIGEESVPVPGPGRWRSVDCCKVMLFANRAPNLTMEEFRGALARRYQDLWRDAAPLRHSYEVAVDLPPGAGELAHDLVICTWWPGRREFIEAWRRFDRKRAEELIDGRRLVGMAVREEPVLWPEHRLPDF